MYLKSFDDSTESTKELKYHFLSHMALDYIVTQLSYSQTSKDYALLLVHDGIAVYGNMTNTNVKFLIGTDAHEDVRFDLSTVSIIHCYDLPIQQLMKYN